MEFQAVLQQSTPQILDVLHPQKFMKECHRALDKHS